MKIRHTVLTSVLGLGLVTGPALQAAPDWPQWRGADQTDISPDTGLLEEWPEGGPEILWTFEGAGLGYSGYSIVDGTLYTMGTRDADLLVIAVDTETGEEEWSTVIATDDQKGYSTGWGHGPRSTPTWSDGHLYALGPKGTLACLTDSGKVEWSLNLADDFGGKAGGWGYSESPLVDDGKVIVAPGGDKAPLVALNAKNGRTIWEAEIPDAGKAEYASVLITEIHGVPQYIKYYQQMVVGVSARDGELLWTSEWPRGRTAVIPTPVVVGNEVYITSGYGAGSKLIQVNDDWSTEDLWDNTEMKNHHGGVVHLDGYIYGFSDGGGLVCQSLETGEVVWNEKGQGMQKGAVHLADGMLYCLNEQDGMVTLVEATPEGFNSAGSFILGPQSDNRSPKGKIWTHPVVLDGKLYLRDQEYVIAFDVKK